MNENDMKFVQVQQPRAEETLLTPLTPELLTPGHVFKMGDVSLTQLMAYFVEVMPLSVGAGERSFRTADFDIDEMVKNIFHGRKMPFRGSVRHDAVEIIDAENRLPNTRPEHIPDSDTATFDIISELGSTVQGWKGISVVRTTLYPGNTREGRSPTVIKIKARAAQQLSDEDMGIAALRRGSQLGAFAYGMNFEWRSILSRIRHAKGSSSSFG